jgi:hypothetical protein
MLLLGLLLLAATGAFTGLLIADNLSGGPEYHVTLLGNTIATMNSLEIFLSGLALALIFCLGLAMTGTGGVLTRRRRSRLREARAARYDAAGYETVRRDDAVRADDAAAKDPGEPLTPAGTGAMTAPSSTTTAPAQSAPSDTSAAPRRHLFGH